MLMRTWSKLLSGYNWGLQRMKIILFWVFLGVLKNFDDLCFWSFSELLIGVLYLVNKLLNLLLLNLLLDFCFFIIFWAVFVFFTFSFWKHLFFRRVLSFLDFLLSHLFLALFLLFLSLVFLFYFLSLQRNNFDIFLLVLGFIFWVATFFCLTFIFRFFLFFIFDDISWNFHLWGFGHFIFLFLFAFRIFLLFLLCFLFLFDLFLSYTFSFSR